MSNKLRPTYNDFIKEFIKTCPEKPRLGLERTCFCGHYFTSDSALKLHRKIHRNLPTSAPTTTVQTTVHLTATNRTIAYPNSTDNLLTTTNQTTADKTNFDLTITDSSDSEPNVEISNTFNLICDNMLIIDNLENWFNKGFN